MKDIQTWTIEALKEGVRVFIAAAIPIFLIQIQQGKIDYKVLGYAGAAAVIKAIDGWVHDWKKSTDSEGNFKGILGI